MHRTQRQQLKPRNRSRFSFYTGTNNILRMRETHRLKSRLHKQNRHQVKRWCEQNKQNVSALYMIL